MEKQKLSIGIIGMGDMGRLYAYKLRDAGWENVVVCDRPEMFEQLCKDLQAVHDGHQVARRCDYVMYSIEAGNLDKVVSQYGPSHKVGSIVAGQTSVKAPEQSAFEEYLPEDVAIISCHSLHGPQVDPTGQPLVLINHRGTQQQVELVERILSSLKSRFVYMSYEEHDLVTANTQAVTHAAFLTMGTAWSQSQEYPWESGMHPGGIEMVKIYLCLRIYGAKWHVYAGLALLNPAARIQVKQYAASSTELFKLMLAGDHTKLVDRVFAARRGVFGWADDEEGHHTLISDEMLDRFDSIAQRINREENLTPQTGKQSQNSNPPPNSHLSLLAIADCWHTLHIDPFRHLELAATPVFRMWMGVTQYLFAKPERLASACRAAMFETQFRSDDLEFVIAARGWAQAVQFRNFEAYHKRFEMTREFFAPRLAQANRVGAEMLKEMKSSSLNP